MASQRFIHTQSVKMQPVMSQAIVMQQANFLQMSDVDFHKLISELEQDPLFIQLYRREKLIQYRKYSGTDIHPLSLHIDDYQVSGSVSPDVEELIAKYPEILNIIRSIGDDKFKKFFLYPQENYSLEDISIMCSISVREIEAINSLVNEVSVFSTFYHPPDSGAQILAYTCLASLEINAEDFTISYLSPVYARGRYIIDYDNIEKLLIERDLHKTDITGIRKILSKLEFINQRKNIIQKILVCLVNKQSLYLKSGKQNTLLPYSQKELASEIGTVPSSVSRAMRLKSIITPWNEEIPLKNLLPNMHVFKKELVKRILETEPTLQSDEVIRKIIRDRFGAQISRRSISALRKELGIILKGNG